MEIIEVKRRLTGIAGGDLVYPNSKLNDFIFNENLEERMKDKIWKIDKSNTKIYYGQVKTPTLIIGLVGKRKFLF